MYEVIYEPPASKWLEKQAKKNPNLVALVAKIVAKIDWLAQNADHIDHEKMKGHAEMSLHFGAYRILYLPERLQQTITIRFIDEHDKAYQRMKRDKK